MVSLTAVRIRICFTRSHATRIFLLEAPRALFAYALKSVVSYCRTFEWGNLPIRWLLLQTVLPNPGWIAIR